MSEIAKLNAGLLKAAGFRKRRFGFNRSASDGIVHVVHFWMAPFEPPAWTEVPGLRERRYGNFRLDFGVWVSDMARSGEPKSTWINEYNCQLRRTIGHLLPGSVNDVWWKLRDENAAAKAEAALTEYGLPWLDRYPSRTAILAEFERHGSLAIGMSPAGALDIADLYQALGRDEDARRTLAQYVSHPVLRSHAAYLSDYLAARGYEDMVERIHTRE